MYKRLDQFKINSYIILRGGFMDNNCLNENNENYIRALEKIERDKRCKPRGCCFGPTGATAPI